MKKENQADEHKAVAPTPQTRLERQADTTLSRRLADLPRPCDVGSKRNATGHQENRIAYKPPVDTAERDIAVRCVLTSASARDSKVAIPLATTKAGRLDNLFDLGDSACEAAEIEAHSRKLGHVPIIDVNRRRDIALKHEWARRKAFERGWSPVGRANPLRGALRRRTRGRQP